MDEDEGLLPRLGLDVGEHLLLGVVQRSPPRPVGGDGLRHGRPPFNCCDRPHEPLRPPVRRRRAGVLGHVLAGGCRASLRMTEAAQPPRQSRYIGTKIRGQKNSEPATVRRWRDAVRPRHLAPALPQQVVLRVLAHPAGEGHVTSLCPRPRRRPARRRDGLVERADRRRVDVLHRREVVQGDPLAHRNGEEVGPLLDALATDHLRADELAACPARRAA